jgi:hypothetical protein
VSLFICCYAECRYVEFSYAVSYYAENERRYVEFNYAVCHYAECCYAEFRYVEFNYAECHYAQSCYAECCGAGFSIRGLEEA